MNIYRAYQRERSKGVPAQWALRNVRTREAWDDAESEGLVRLRVEPDECVSIDDLEGDCFNPRANPDIPASKLERQRAEFIEEVNREGVWGMIGEYFDGEEWQHGDSVWGFVGSGWRDSGYDTDVMQTTLDALAKLTRCPTCGRPNRT